MCFLLIGKIELEKLGLFGDSFGVLTSLFSGLAFSGLIWTILLQREDLNRQRNEFKKLNFENSLFFLMRNHKEIASSVKFQKDQLEIDPFELLFEQFAKVYRSQAQEHSVNADKITKKDRVRLIIAGAYNKCFGFECIQLRQYYRSLFAIISYIHDSPNDTRKYIKLLQTQLSDFEMLFVFYHGLSDQGQDYKYLIENTAFLEDIMLHRLVDYHNDIALYDKRAFGTSNV